MKTEKRRLLRAARKRFSGTCLSLLALSALGCGEENFSQTAEPVGKAQQNAYVDTWIDPQTGYGGVWQNINNIRVCWETDALIAAAVGTDYNPIDTHNYNPAQYPLDYQPLASLAQVREWAKQAVIRAWQDPSRLTFTGWADCTPGEDAIHIAVFNWSGFTRGRGEFLRKKPNGMWLDAWAGADKQRAPAPLSIPPIPGAYRNCDGSSPLYDGFNPGWKGTQKSCVEDTAIHEFGHALGFIHEHNRPENTGANLHKLCPFFGTESVIPTSDTVGPYDPFSIMNYCNRFVHNEGWPSVFDIKGLHTYYGVRWETQPGLLGHVAAAQQSANRTTIVSIGGDGALYSRYLHVNTPATQPVQPRHIDPWSAPVRISALGAAPEGGGVALAKRGTNQEELDAFYVGSNAALYYSKSVNLGAWSAPVAVTPTNVVGGGGIATGFRNGNELNVFVVGFNGSINRVTATGTGAFAAPVPITAPGYALQGGALATGIQNGTRLAVFTVGADGAVKALTKAMTAPLNDAWSSVTISAPNFAPAGAALATGMQNGSQLDVFVVGNDNRLHYFWAVGNGWQGPDLTTFPDGVFSPGGKLAALTQGNHLHVYLVGNYGPNGHLMSAWHNGASWSPIYASESFLPLSEEDWWTATYALPSTGVAAALTPFASKPSVFFAGLSGLIRAWYSPVANRYTKPTQGDSRPHGATTWPAEMHNQPTRFAPMR